MNCFIYTGGELCPAGISEKPAEGDLILAADAGYRNALLLGVKPSLLLGDFDSLGEDHLPDDVELLRVPAEKDVTDTQLAVQVALERGADRITLVGGLSGRLDHTLSNLALLELLWEKKCRALITDGKNRVRFLKNDSTLILRDPAFRYLGLIAAEEKVSGVTLEGCKYPLTNAKLKRDHQYAVSNEITGNCAFLSVRRGGIWIIESRD